LLNRTGQAAGDPDAEGDVPLLEVHPAFARCFLVRAFSNSCLLFLIPRFPSLSEISGSMPGKSRRFLGLGSRTFTSLRRRVRYFGDQLGVFQGLLVLLHGDILEIEMVAIAHRYNNGGG
jgi:hypothetical protein